MREGGTREREKDGGALPGGARLFGLSLYEGRATRLGSASRSAASVRTVTAATKGLAAAGGVAAAIMAGPSREEAPPMEESRSAAPERPARSAALRDGSLTRRSQQPNKARALPASGWEAHGT